MISKRRPNDAYVWIWLPGRTDPVVAGRLLPGADGRLGFAYGQSYLGRRDAIPIYAPELPLERGQQVPMGLLTMPSCIRDGSPDAWGRRVIINRLVGAKGKDADTITLDELTYLMESGSDRIGALDFQASATEYVPRLSANVPLEELIEAVERVEAGRTLTPELEQALNHGTSIGGARPKVLVEDGAKKLIAKFSASNDTYSVVKGEYVAMRLAMHAGLDVAPVRMTRAAHKDVLLVERFDRVLSGTGWERRALVSALTILELDEMLARYAAYDQLVEVVNRRFTNAGATRRELFGRIVFNILAGNTDDHARNHAAFWDGTALTLTPAYDICPQARSGREASQAMLIAGEENHSRIAVCLDAAPIFGLSRKQAVGVVEHQLTRIARFWTETCDEAEVTETDRRLFMGRQFLNPYAFEGLTGGDEALQRLADGIRMAVLSGGEPTQAE